MGASPVCAAFYAYEAAASALAEVWRTSKGETNKAVEEAQTALYQAKRELKAAYDKQLDAVLGWDRKYTECINIHAIQRADPASKSDPYLCGYFNGMELMMSILDGREAQFLECTNADS
jgi:hypothetical protein